MMYRHNAQFYINDAHSAIADAEARLMHSFTDEDIAAANDELASAQAYLARAVAARDAWNMVEHDDYENYPEIPRHSQRTLGI